MVESNVYHKNTHVQRSISTLTIYINKQVLPKLCIPVLPELLLLLDDSSSSSGCVDLDSGSTKLVSQSDIELTANNLSTLLVEGDEGSSGAPGPGRGTR